MGKCLRVAAMAQCIVMAAVLRVGALEPPRVEVVAVTPIPEYASPMTLRVPFEMKESGAWVTFDLAKYICDKVSIEQLQVHTKPKGKEWIAVEFLAIVRTRPPQDKEARIRVAIGAKDDEELVLQLWNSMGPERSAVTTINAEEGKTRTKWMRMKARRKDFEQLAAAGDLQLTVTLTVEDN